jgi:U3 small nucleolar RNA-associated protein 23
MPELKSVASTSTSTQPPRKKKGPKGPNPLSVKKKKPKERPQPSYRGEASSASRQQFSAGSKRKLEQVESSVSEVRMHGDDTIENKRKRRKKSDSDSHYVQ